MSKKYDKAFKVQTGPMIQEEGKAVTQVARELGISANTLYRWVAEYKQDGSEAFGYLKAEERPCTTLPKTGTNLCIYASIPLPVPGCKDVRRV
jgi:transposase